MKRFVVTVMFTLFATSVTVQADTVGERVTYPGLMCRYFGTQGNDSYFDPTGYSANGLRNITRSTVYAACPIAKPDYDNQQAPGEQRGQTMMARITMSSSSDNCKLYRRSLTGSSSGWWATKTIVSESNGLYRHIIEPPDGYTYMSSSNSSISLYCAVPGGVYINNYDHKTYWQ
jgi:hypothetical protein